MYIINSLARIIREKNVSMEIKERVKEQYTPANTDVWMRDLDRNKAQQSRVCGVERSYLRGARGL